MDSSHEPNDVKAYRKWKQMVPFVYDWFTNHSLAWPSLSCRWGPVTAEATHKFSQLAYISEQTDMSEMNTLQIVSCDVIKSNVAASENISNFNEQNKSPYIKPEKTIYHPGEVNKIRELHQYPDTVVTHTDAPELFVWVTRNQPHRAQEKAISPQQCSIPDLYLVGHTEDAEFALSCNSVEPLVASGGKDMQVLVWNIRDHQAISMTDPSATTGSSRVMARNTLSGHKSTIEDVCWQPGSANTLASVGDDGRFILWDLRLPGPCSTLHDAHGSPNDIHCVDWSMLQTHLLATACAQGLLKIWDQRKLGMNDGDALKTIEAHGEAIQCLAWCPGKEGIVATGSEDNSLCVWDSQGSATLSRSHGGPAVPDELLFNHAGHRSPVVDFQWNPCDPWTVLSVSDDAVGDDGGDGGGTMQLWRMLDILHQDEEEALLELEKHRDFIQYGDGMSSETETSEGKN